MNNPKKMFVAVGLAAAVLSGCSAAPVSRYAWDGYDYALYQYYQDPAKSANFVSQLKHIIDNAEKHNLKVPPGIYAEYGYFLMQENDIPGAVRNFEKERAAWPEAVPFMNKMIAVAQGGNRKELEAAPVAKPASLKPAETQNSSAAAAPVSTQEKSDAKTPAANEANPASSAEAASPKPVEAPTPTVKAEEQASESAKPTSQTQEKGSAK